jgi:hypothetical protein
MHGRFSSDHQPVGHKSRGRLSDRFCACIAPFQNDALVILRSPAVEFMLDLNGKKTSAIDVDGLDSKRWVHTGKRAPHARSASLDEYLATNKKTANSPVITTTGSTGLRI